MVMVAGSLDMGAGGAWAPDLSNPEFAFDLRGRTAELSPDIKPPKLECSSGTRSTVHTQKASFSRTGSLALNPKAAMHLSPAASGWSSYSSLCPGIGVRAQPRSRSPISRMTAGAREGAWKAAGMPRPPRAVRGGTGDGGASGIGRASRRVALVYLLVALTCSIHLAVTTVPYDAADEPNQFLRATQVGQGGVFGLKLAGGDAGGRLPIGVIRSDALDRLVHGLGHDRIARPVLAPYRTIPWGRDDGPVGLPEHRHLRTRHVWSGCRGDRSRPPRRLAGARDAQGGARRQRRLRERARVRRDPDRRCRPAFPRARAHAPDDAVPVRVGQSGRDADRLRRRRRRLAQPAARRARPPDGRPGSASAPFSARWRWAGLPTRSWPRSSSR